MNPWAVALVLGLAVTSALGCAYAPRAKSPVVRPAASKERAGRSSYPPPLALATPEDAVVRILGPQTTCTGTLITDELVLTAHHCVVERGPRGEFTTKMVRPEDMTIELGGDYLPWGEIGVYAIVAPPCGEAGGAGDIAVMVLERKLVGIATLPPRLDAPPQVGEPLGPVGFGRCATSADAIRRRERAGGAVRAITGETIEMVASVCPGDSGGPLLALGGHEVVGVVSLSAMDGDDHTREMSVMARIDAYRSVLSHARLIADGIDPADLPPLSCAP